MALCQFIDKVILYDLLLRILMLPVTSKYAVIHLRLCEIE